MRGDEAEVVEAFKATLERDGWTVRVGKPTEADLYADLYADHTEDDGHMVVEAKGSAGGDSGTAIDILYGQLLRRMTEQDDPKTIYAAVVRDDPQGARAVQRVPQRIRDQLRIRAFAVGHDGRPRELRQDHP